MNGPADLASWIRAMMARDASAFFLRQVIWTDKGRSYAPVTAFEDVSQSPKDIAEAALEAAAEDAGDTGGPQTYVLCAERDGVNLGRKSWRVAGTVSDDPSPTEPPNMAGVLAQMMRHMEAEKRIAATERQSMHGLMQDVLDHYKEITRDQREELQKHRARELEVMEHYEMLTGHAHERTLAQEKQSHQLAMRARAFEHLDPVIAILMHKVFKLPLAPTVAGGPLDKFLSSITEEQSEKLSQVLTREQLIAVGELYAERQKAHAADAAKRAPQNGTPQNGGPS